MAGVRFASGVLIIGALCVALAYVDLAVVSPICAVMAVVGLPMLVTARRLGRGGGDDVTGRAATAFGGLAVSCWSLWFAGVTLGLHRWTLLVAPVVASALIAATTGIDDHPRSGRSGARKTPGATGPCHVQAVVWLTAAVIVLLVLVPFLPYGLERTDGIHRMGMTDWYKHLMVTTALGGPAFPPANPFLMTDLHGTYYYGFHLLAAGVQKAAGIADSYPVLLWLTLLTAAAFPLVVFVVARGLFGDARRAAVAAVGATLLAGFDLVVWIIHAVRDVVAAWPLSPGLRGLRAAVPSTHLDFWIHHNERQFSPPYVSVIWAPQHVMAVLVALLAWHALHRASSDRPSLREALLPALLLAALPALSAYVAIALACGLLAGVAVDGWRERRAPWHTASARRWLATALLAFVAAIPVMWVLSRGESGQLIVAVSSAGNWLNGAVFSTMFGDRTVTRLLDTPALYLVELGVIGLLGLAAIRERIARGTLSGQQREAAAIVAAILVLVTFVRPAGDGPNNLYARPMLIVWALLACFAADAWCAGAGRRWWRRAGVAVGAGGIMLGALGATAEGFAFWATPADAVRAARWINERTSLSAVIAADPERHNLGYWLRRRTVIADRRHAVLFGATGEQYDDTLARLRQAYDAANPAEAARRFAGLGADVVIVDSPAPAWAEAPCFDVGYRGARVTVLTRSRAGCGP